MPLSDIHHDDKSMKRWENLIGVVEKEGLMSRCRYFGFAFPRILQHYFTALWGIGLKLDPQMQPDPSMAETTAILAVWAGVLSVAVRQWQHGDPTLALGLVFFWGSPLWLYSLEPYLYPDMVFEYRSYLAVLGFAVMLTRLPFYIGIAFVIVWSIQSFKRSFAFRTPQSYAAQAIRENPLAKRPVNNLRLFNDFYIAKEVNRLLMAGEPIPPELLAKHNPI